MSWKSIASTPCALLVLVFVPTLMIPAVAEATSVPLELVEAPIEKSAEAASPAFGLAEQLDGAPAAHLSKASADLIDQVESWNLGGGRPWREGVVRPLESPVAVRFDRDSLAEAAGWSHGGVYLRAGSTTQDGGTVRWATEIRVDAAERVRLRLADVQLPSTARLWVYGASGPETAVPFGPSLAHEGVLVTPSVRGESIRLEVELPADALGDDSGFVIDRVVELFPLGPRGEVLAADGVGTWLQKADVTCLVDTSCVTTSTFPAVRDAERAIAQLRFVDGSFSFRCTGGLLADTEPGSVIPYLLTANHCFDSQASASSLEATFDLKTNGCAGTIPNPDNLPKVNGSTLEATGFSSDYTLVRLSSTPSGTRAYLGWTTEAVAAGTNVHRISHPVANGSLYTQVYTRYEVRADQPCGFSRAQFLNLDFVEGGSFGGSSGAPSMLGDGRVVGSLTGACGPNPAEGCDYRNVEIDGAFTTTGPALAPWLDPTPIFTDGFESGDTSAWTSAVP